ncbi:hypothetical protein BDV33DRAFT_206445 [Aspergillus novoparasiticus]|uniref:Uncharacterized protein n=1 Tax=Aspergillus novoparasiticus TaxID=986946 RepID=A0A5N6EKL0_9EURO|nr:hypothetical protein BDV33DRAFT_206445 [Aspergillus novoparasiticus]
MNSWDSTEKQYYAEVSLLRHGKRIIDYDTKRDSKDLDKTQRTAADVIQYIKQGMLSVSVTEKHRDGEYTSPGYIFLTPLDDGKEPTQEAAREKMLEYLEGLFSRESMPGTQKNTKKKSRAEPRTLGRPQIEDRQTFLSHQTVSDTSDDWFEKEICDWVNSDR